MEARHDHPRQEQTDPNRFERRAHAMIATMAEAGEVPEPDRRDNDRQRYLAQATLRPGTPDNQPGEELTLYTRDLTGQGVGFIAAGELPADGRAIVELPGTAGRAIQAEGQVVRVQRFATGWHEGYVQFEAPINFFCDQPVRAA